MNSNLLKKNRYFQFLGEIGAYVLTVDGVDWFEYSGFMVPAYLPDCCPEISFDVAKKVVQFSGRIFVRWHTKFRQVQNTQWWYIIRRGPWSLEQCSGNTRSKIKRGRKKLHARIVTDKELVTQGYDVCRKAVTRYEKNLFLKPRGVYEKIISAAKHYRDVYECFGVFCGEQLVGLSENYIQGESVFWDSIWYDPVFLPKYSSYMLIDAMLDYYLNQKKMQSVCDGCRRLLHRTEVHEFLMDKFSFVKEYAVLNIVYSGRFGLAVQAAYPFRKTVQLLADRLQSRFFDNFYAVLQQEHIRRADES